MTDTERRNLEYELEYIERSISWTLSRASAEGESVAPGVLDGPRARAREIRELLGSTEGGGLE
jgi:hypothetical protein